MQLVITFDANSESGVNQVVYELSGPTKRHFQSKEYGLDLQVLGIVLTCRDPELNFKQRISYKKKEKALDMDIMLDLDEMKKADVKFRKQIIIEHIANEVPRVLKKYALSDFNESRFIDDLRTWLKRIS